jgi:hypothetical protein
MGHIEVTTSRFRLGWLGILVLHGAILAGGVTWGAYRATQLSAERALPTLRNEPRSISPLYDFPDVVSDEQLGRALGKLRPRFAGEKTRINHVDHALRFWGLEAQFDDPDYLSGEEMRQILVDHRRFAEVFGADTAPLLIDTDRGVRVRVQEGLATSSHHDHTLAGLAEVGTPLSFPVHTSGGDTTLRALLEQSLCDFSLNQVEYEWSVLAYALYLETPGRWISSEGQEITFDRLAERIMRQDLPQGVCSANHRMHALVALLRVDEETRILSDGSRRRILDYLQGVTQILVSTQHSDGSWNEHWPGAAAHSAAETEEEDPLALQILATGHPMEWWALAPEELLPPRPALQRAAHWLCRTIEGLSPEEIEGYYTYLSHAGRALALWRGCTPAEVNMAPLAPAAKKSL